MSNINGWKLVYNDKYNKEWKKGKYILAVHPETITSFGSDKYEIRLSKENGRFGVTDIKVWGLFANKRQAVKYAEKLMRLPIRKMLDNPNFL